MPPKKSKPQSPLPPITRSTKVRSSLLDGIADDKISEELRYVVFSFEQILDEFKRDIISQLRAKDDKIASLEGRVVELSKEVQSLKDTVDDGLTLNRQDEIVISGDAVSSQAGIIEDTAVRTRDILKTLLKYELAPHNILFAKRLGKKLTSQGPDNRKILLKVVNTQVKTDLMLACKSSKPTNLYLNDNLTPTRARILFTLRQAKKKKPNVVQGCTSVRGDIFAWIKSPNPSGKNPRILLNSWDKLSDFCEKYLSMKADDLIHHIS